MNGGGNPGWYFAPTLGSPTDGLNDSSREHFASAHEKYLAREIIQNSLDAKKQELGENVPVRVVFELRSSKLSDITGLGEMRGILEKAKKFSDDQEGATEYYDSALKAVSQDDILVLRVGDYNTKGLDGADDDTSGNWARLVLMEGASSKKGDGGGSFGIGKNAVYVASALRTVYYVSRNSLGELVFAGKAKISSFEQDGELRRGAGQYGNVVEGKPYITSIRGDGNISDYFKREEQGTDIFIAGYMPTDPDDWRGKLIEAVLADFWAAIYFGNLVVELKDDSGNSDVIDAASLKTYLEEYKDSDDNALPYYLALVGGEPIIGDLKHIGKVKLYVRVGEGMPRRIAMMRKPKMIVQKKQIQTLHEDYAGVLICDDDKGNDTLRKLEPPAHDRWEHGRSGNKYSTALLELESFLRETLRSMNPDLSTLAEDVPGLSRYLWDIEERDDLQAFNAMKGENTTNTTGSESPREVGAVGEDTRLPKPVKTQVMTIVGGSGSGGDGPHKPRPKPPGPPRPTPPGPKPGPNPQIGAESFEFRSFIQRKDGDVVYQVILKPFRDAKGSIKLLTVGEDGEFPADVASVVDGSGKSYEVEDSMVKGVELAKGNNLNLSIKLDSKRRYVLGVESHEL